MIRLTNSNNRIKYIILLVCLCSCHKHKYEACFSVSKDKFNVNEQIVFEDCSNYDDGQEWAFWDFGDGTKINTQKKESAVYSYSQAGEYTVYLRIGTKEWGSSITKPIVIE